MLNITNYYRNANQNYNEVSSHTNQNGHCQNKKIYTVNAGEGMEKRESSYTVGGKVSWHSHDENQYESSSEN